MHVFRLRNNTDNIAILTIYNEMRAVGVGGQQGDKYNLV